MAARMAGLFRYRRATLKPAKTTHAIQHASQAAIKAFFATPEVWQLAVTRTPDLNRRLRSALVRSLKQSLLPETFYRALALTLIDETGAINVRAPLYAWAKHVLFLGDGMLMFFELAKYVTPPVAPTLQWQEISGEPLRGSPAAVSGSGGEWPDDLSQWPGDHPQPGAAPELAPTPDEGRAPWDALVGG